jgi:hypothetical protein
LFVVEVLCVDVTAVAKKEPEIGCVSWATVWATTTGALLINVSGGKESAGVDHLQTVQWVTRKTTPQNHQAGGSHGRPSQISQVFSQQPVRQPQALLGSNLFDEKELRPETLRPDRCRLLGFDPPQV